MASDVEKLYLDTLRFDVCHYTLFFSFGDNYYYLESWVKKNRVIHRIYYRHDGQVTYTVKILIDADHENGIYAIEVRHKWPRFGSWARKLTRKQYNEILKNITKLITFAHKQEVS